MFCGLCFESGKELKSIQNECKEIFEKTVQGSSPIEMICSSCERKLTEKKLLSANINSDNMPIDIKIENMDPVETEFMETCVSENGNKINLDFVIKEEKYTLNSDSFTHPRVLMAGLKATSSASSSVSNSKRHGSGDAISQSSAAKKSCPDLVEPTNLVEHGTESVSITQDFTAASNVERDSSHTKTICSDSTDNEMDSSAEDTDDEDTFIALTNSTQQANSLNSESEIIECQGNGRLRKVVEHRNFVANQIAKGIYTLTQPHYKARSFIWNVLSVIEKEDKTLINGLVYCRICCRILKRSGNQSSNLSRHKCCLAIKQPSISQTVTADDKKNALEACTAWVVEDCRPFSAISGTGFVKLANFFIKIGATYGENIDVNDLLPDSKTISQNASSI